MTESGATEATPVVGRFAPSPTGRMHAGNIYAALIAWLVAKSQGGHMVLRIEDSTASARRAPTSTRSSVIETLGLFWDEGPYFQHDRDEAYAEAFGRLEARGFCTRACTRADLHVASAPHRGEKLVYAGTCRHLSDAEVEARWAAGRTPGWRVAVDSRTIAFEDLVQGTYAQKLDRDCGDFLIRRPTARSPISWQWWWTMPPRASIRSCAASICFAPPRSSATSRIFSGCRTPPMRTFRCLWPSRTGASRNAIGTRP